MKSIVYKKTQEGVVEVLQRKLKIATMLRGLLAMIDGQTSVDDLIKKVPSLKFTEASFVELLSMGLIENTIADAPEMTPVGTQVTKLQAEQTPAPPPAKMPLEVPKTKSDESKAQSKIEESTKTDVAPVIVNSLVKSSVALSQSTTFFVSEQPQPAQKKIEIAHESSIVSTKTQHDTQEEIKKTSSFRVIDVDDAVQQKRHMAASSSTRISESIPTSSLIEPSSPVRSSSSEKSIHTLTSFFKKSLLIQKKDDVVIIQPGISSPNKIASVDIDVQIITEPVDIVDTSLDEIKKLDQHAKNKQKTTITSVEIASDTDRKKIDAKTIDAHAQMTASRDHMLDLIKKTWWRGTFLKRKIESAQSIDELRALREELISVLVASDGGMSRDMANDLDNALYQTDI